MMNYCDHLVQVKVASFDIEHKVSLCDSSKMCFSLDNYFKIKFEKFKDRPKSVDAIYSKNRSFNSDNYFLEFKNQTFDNIKINEIYEKIYNSVIVFISDNCSNIDFCKNTIFYLLW